MSHYTVAVIHHPDQDIDDLLAPFSENIRVPKYISHTKQHAIDHVRKYWKGLDDLTDDQCYDLIAAEYEDDMKDADGNLYSTYNPDSKWDWYDAEGGRWPGLLKRKGTGERCNEGRIGDLDFSMDDQEYEEYAERCAVFSTYAVLTPDGVWHAPGEMGWFGCSTESADEARDWELNYVKRFIESADPDDIMTIVDCHI